MVLGGKGITEPLEAAGIETVPPLRGTAADAVLAGWYRQELTFESLEAAVEAVSAGAAFYSASQSPYFATAEGRALGIVPRHQRRRPRHHRLHGDRRGQARRCRRCGRRPHVTSGVAADELAVVGDDPELEVPMAHKGGALAVAVHTGIGHAQSFTELPEEVRPHLDLADVGVLAGLLTRGRPN